MGDFEFLSVEFEFEGAKYYSLVRKKKLNSNIEYHVTIMDGKLEKMLYGNHIFRQVNNMLVSDKVSTDKKVGELKSTVIKALQRHLEREQPDAVAVSQ